MSLNPGVCSPNCGKRSQKVISSEVHRAIAKGAFAKGFAKAFSQYKAVKQVLKNTADMASEHLLINPLQNLLDPFGSIDSPVTNFRPRRHGPACGSSGRPLRRGREADLR